METYTGFTPLKGTFTGTRPYNIAFIHSTLDNWWSSERGDYLLNLSTIYATQATCNNSFAFFFAFFSTVADDAESCFVKLFELHVNKNLMDWNFLKLFENVVQQWNDNFPCWNIVGSTRWEPLCAIKAILDNYQKQIARLNKFQTCGAEKKKLFKH